MHAPWFVRPLLKRIILFRLTFFVVLMGCLTFGMLASLQPIVDGGVGARPQRVHLLRRPPLVGLARRRRVGPRGDARAVALRAPDQEHARAPADGARGRRPPAPSRAARARRRDCAAPRCQQDPSLPSGGRVRLRWQLRHARRQRDRIQLWRGRVGRGAIGGARRGGGGRWRGAAAPCEPRDCLGSQVGGGRHGSLGLALGPRWAAAPQGRPSSRSTAISINHYYWPLLSTVTINHHLQLLTIVTHQYQPLLVTIVSQYGWPLISQ